MCIVAFALAQNRIELETKYKLSPDVQRRCGGVADENTREHDELPGKLLSARAHVLHIRSIIYSINLRIFLVHHDDDQ